MKLGGLLEYRSLVLMVVYSIKCCIAVAVMILDEQIFAVACGVPLNFLQLILTTIAHITLYLFFYTYER